VRVTVQSGVISLSKLIVREKADTRGSSGIYLICQSKQSPEMYELVCRSVDDMAAWAATINQAIAHCASLQRQGTARRLRFVRRYDTIRYDTRCYFNVRSKDDMYKKGSPYSNTERRVPELIPVLGSQPAGDVSHKPGGRLPLLSARPAVTPATLKRAVASFAAW